MDKMQEKLQELKGDLPLMVEAGFIAIKQIDEDSARKCFYAAMVMDPEHSLPVLGLGLVSLLKLELDEAKKMFKMVLEKEPDNEMARSYLGVANLYTITDGGLKEGRQLLDEASRKTDDQEIKDLGKHSHDLYKEIKKKMKDLHPLESDQKLPPTKRLKKK